MRPVSAVACLLGLSCLLAPACTFGEPAAQPLVTSKDQSAFPDKMPGEINKKVIQNVHFRVTAPSDTPVMTIKTKADTVTILGDAVATQEQMVEFIQKRNPQPKLNCTLKEIVQFYYQEAGKEGVRPDVALCQALKETGFFAYGGDVSPQQNNFCGLGALGHNHEPGYSFATPQLGVRAHIQHLLAYTQKHPPVQKLVDPRYQHVVNNRPDLHGNVHTWTKLNGAWAVPGKTYGQDILALWQAAQAPSDSDASLTAASKKIAEEPSEANAYIYRGIVFYRRADYEKAKQDFSQAAKIDPTNGEIYYNLALTADKQGNRKAARQAYDKLLTLQSNFLPGYYNRALLRYNTRDYDGAIADCETLLNFEEHHADARNLIGLCHIAQKKYAEAWTDFAAAGKINSTNLNIQANQFIMQACLK